MKTDLIVDLNAWFRKTSYMLLPCIVFAVAVKAEDDGILGIGSITGWYMDQKASIAHCGIIMTIRVESPSRSQTASRSVPVFQSTDEASDQNNCYDDYKIKKMILFSTIPKLNKTHFSCASVTLL